MSVLVEGCQEWAAVPYPPGQTSQPLLSCSCQCQEYVSAEELCDAQCLAKAPQLSLAWGSSRELILSVKGEAGDHDQRVSPPRGRAGIEGQPLPAGDKGEKNLPGTLAAETRQQKREHHLSGSVG